MANEVLPKDGNVDIPIEFSKFYPSELEAKKIKKPLICYLLDIDNEKKTRPTLVTKPIKVKYGQKWFTAGNNRYFINYSQIMNFGKHYAYLCQFGNSVGALSFYKYPEIVDSNQVELMVHQHSVEVFKKNKGISPKLVMIIAIVCAIAVIGLVIASNVAMGLNAQLTNEKARTTILNDRIVDLREQLTNLGVEPVI